MTTDGVVEPIVLLAENEPTISPLPAVRRVSIDELQSNVAKVASSVQGVVIIVQRALDESALQSALASLSLYREVDPLAPLAWVGRRVPADLRDALAKLRCWVIDGGVPNAALHAVRSVHALARVGPATVQAHARRLATRHGLSDGQLRVLELSADQPGVQFYSGNFLDGSNKGKGGVVYQQYTGLCLESQKFPNSINVPAWKDEVILKPGATYKHTMVHKFSVE